MIRNLLIFLAIALTVTAGYMYFTQDSGSSTSLVSSTSPLPSTPQAAAYPSSVSQDDFLTQDFLSLLLSVKNIKLDDSIFSDPAFNGLRDSTIIITPEGNEGRPNPFAQFGTDNIEAPVPVVPPDSTQTQSQDPGAVGDSTAPSPAPSTPSSVPAGTTEPSPVSE